MEELVHHSFSSFVFLFHLKFHECIYTQTAHFALVLRLFINNAVKGITSTRNPPLVFLIFIAIQNGPSWEGSIVFEGAETCQLSFS